LFFRKLSSSESRVYSQYLANQESESSTNTSNVVKSKGNGSLAINVCVQNTMDVLEIVLGIFNDE